MLMKFDELRRGVALTQERWALLPYIGLIAGSLILPLAVFAVAGWQNWRQLVTSVEDRAQKRAILAAEHALKVFHSSEQVLRRIDDRVRALDWDDIALSPQLNAFLTELPKDVDYLEGAGLIRPDGRLANVSAAFPTPATNLGDRDYFLAPRREAGRTVVSAPVVGRISGQSLLRLARLRSGEADGVIFVSMSPAYFSQFYRSITEGEHSVTMIRGDGTVLVREPTITTGVDVLAPSTGFMHGIARAEQGIYRTVSQLDGVERLHAFCASAPIPFMRAMGGAFARSNASGRPTCSPSASLP